MQILSLEKFVEILLPIFLFVLNFVNELGYLSKSRDELVYAKKLGVDMMINNSTFKFDILVSSKLKSSVSPPKETSPIPTL